SRQEPGQVPPSLRADEHREVASAGVSLHARQQFSSGPTWWILPSAGAWSASLCSLPQFVQLQLHPVEPEPFALAQMPVFGLTRSGSNPGRELCDQRFSMIV